MNKNLQAVFASIGCCVLFTGLLAIASFTKSFFPPQFERYAYGVIGMLVALFTVWLFLKLGKKNWTYAGLNWEASTPQRFFTGMLAGLLLSVLMIFVIVYFNDLTITASGNFNVPVFFTWAMALLLLSWMEEIAFRSYAFFHLNKHTNAWITQVIIAILFALYHVAGGHDMVTAFLGPGTWAFIFGWAVLRTGGIAMATGIHFSANLVQTALGQKKQYPALWKIEPTHELTTAAQQQIDTTGIYIQLTLLILGLVLTYNVAKKRKLQKVVNN